VLRVAVNSLKHGAPDIEVPVLIVGGSMVGLSAALLLGHHGVRSLVIEHHRGTAIHPRAASVTQRTMEIFRSVGLEDVIRSRSEQQFVQDAGVVGVETLAGGATAHYIANFNDGIRDLSPTVRVFLSQNALEPTLKEAAERNGAQLRFATDCISLQQDASGVTAVIRQRDTAETHTVRAQYAIAADGAHSRMRRELGITMRGHGSFSKSITIYFRADLRRFLEANPAAVVYVNHPELRGFFRFEKPFESAFLVVNTVGHVTTPNADVSTGLTTDRALHFVRTAIGVPDMPVTIENVMHWSATADTAERLREGRVFIAGDAAHVMPPTGGWGGNTGIQDAHNLAWKLGLVLAGTAGADLLSTYEQERLPVAELTVEQAFTRYVLRTDPSIPRDGMQPPVNDLDVELGYRYRSTAIVNAEVAGTAGSGSPANAMHVNPRESRAMPGTRAPHYWLHRRGVQISTLDLCGRNFTLLAGAQAEAWCDAAHAAASRIGVALDVHRIGVDDLHDPADGFAAAYGLAPSGCVLVRPDGFIAWRATNGDGASEAVLSGHLRSILGSS
jgi:2-polyprenyl-6-methoxyphenol hydroxylase-like FAD-dependent oxidoreductase